MMRGLVAGAVVLATVGGGVSADPGSQARSDDLGFAVKAVHRAGAVGVVAEVHDGGRVQRARAGVADLVDRRQVPWNGYYRIGSTTKTMTATVVLQLVAESRLQLTDTVDKWLPGTVRGAGNDGRRITVTNLLRQTSGLNDWNNEHPLAGDPTPERYRQERFRSYRPIDMVRLALRKPPAWLPQPRDPSAERRWAYSNTNYVLLGMIVERVTGQPWEQAVHDRIVVPLRLRHTITGVSAYVPQPSATAYLQFPDRNELTDVSVLVDGGSADAGVISTPSDVATFFQALLSGRLLPSAQLAAMRETVPAKDFDGFPGTRYGLGLAWRPAKGCQAGIWHHHGNTPGMGSRNGVTADGGRAVAVSISTQRATVAQQTQDEAARTLVDSVLCG